LPYNICRENKIVGQALRLPEALALQPQMTEQLPAMSAQLEYLNSQIKQAVADGQLMESTAKNIGTLLSGARTDLFFRSVNELFSWAQWSELNDRFYQTIAFGTGGLRGRTIGRIVTAAERGNAKTSDHNFPASVRTR